MRLFLPCLPLLLVFSSLLPAQTPAQRAWQLGQQAMDRDRFDEAIGQFQISLRLEPTLVKSHLSLAAAYLAVGEDGRAAPHLASYLQARPHHFLVRLHYGELLQRLKRPAEAAPQLERVVAEVQDFPHLADTHLIGCHTRLMEIAEDTGDDYAEHLNRGIGLYLLAKKRAEGDDRRSRHLAEELLCKAAAELTLARLRRPYEARPCWYLHGVWAQLAQRQPAVKWLRAAHGKALPGALTPAETRALYLAASSLRLEMERK
jgi:Tfp pilus assembly protein PilF